MKDLRGIAFFVAFVAIAGFIACGGGGGGGGGKYAEVIKASNEMGKIMEKFIEGMEKADSASEVAAALNGFNKGMEKLKPKMDALEEKFPEMKGEDMPPELADIEKKWEALGARMMGAMTKIMQYADDPEVMEANKKFEGFMN